MDPKETWCVGMQIGFVCRRHVGGGFCIYVTGMMVCIQVGIFTDPQNYQLLKKD